jgi:pimeloyl-ACP methyl ester carboxylesterase
MHTLNLLIVALMVVSQLSESARLTHIEDDRAIIATSGRLGEGIPQDRFFDSKGVRIRYIDQGEGPVVILVHGYLGNVERHWFKTSVFGDLVKDHRVIALDCRGHGKSDKPTTPEAYGAEMGKDIVRLLDHLNIPRAHVVGFSMGAIIAGHLLTTEPDRLLSVTLVAHYPVHAWTSADTRDAEAEARDLESDTPFRSLILAISSPNAVPPESEIRKVSRELAAGNDVKSLAAYHRGRATLATTDEALAAVHVPTLGIIGSADPGLAGMQEAKKVMAALTDVIVVDGATHGGESGVLRRREFLTALRGFLTQHDEMVVTNFESDINP